jgi:hypothetical protein
LFLMKIRVRAMKKVCEVGGVFCCDGSMGEPSFNRIIRMKVIIFC